LVMGHANGFWWKNWACTVLQPNLCPGSWQLTRSSTTSMSALNFVSSPPTMKRSCLRVITGDESWVYGYDPETKRQSSRWKSPTSPRPKKTRQVKSNLKSMIITFFDIKGIVHKEFVPTGQTVNSGSTVKFCGDCRKKCEDIIPNFGENRPGCFTMTMHCLTLMSSPTSFWQKTKLLLSPTHHTPLIWHPVTSSYFLKWNWSWKDAGSIPLRRFRPKRRKCFNTLTEKDFQEAFQKWRRRWDRCLHSGGNYFEGDGGR